LYKSPYRIILESLIDAIAYSIAGDKLASTMDQVGEAHAPVIITRMGAGSVVMISLDDYQALEETAYLLRSQKNAIVYSIPSPNWRVAKVANAHYPKE
jgi:antitoxin YefM